MAFAIIGSEPLEDPKKERDDDGDCQKLEVFIRTLEVGVNYDSSRHKK
ncbi:MAG: hypothetical protein ACJAQT_004642 [Akkermansiaceae bacterium]